MKGIFGVFHTNLEVSDLVEVVLHELRGVKLEEIMYYDSRLSLA